MPGSRTKPSLPGVLSGFNYNKSISTLLNRLHLSTGTVWMRLLGIFECNVDVVDGKRGALVEIARGGQISQKIVIAN
jgi:hypothetical protein